MRHVRAQQLQVTAHYRIEGCKRHRARRRCGGLAKVELHGFEEFVAEVIPKKFVKPLCDFTETVIGISLLKVGRQLIEPRHDIEVVGRQPGRVRNTLAAVGARHLAETAGVVELVGEIAAFFDRTFVEAKVGTHRRDAQKPEAQAVGAVFFHQVDRIGRIAQRFAHLAALQVADDRSEKHIAEGDLARKAEAGHDHARDPEKDDVRSSY